MDKLEEEYAERMMRERDEWFEEERHADESRRRAKSLRGYRKEYAEMMTKDDKMEMITLEKVHKKAEKEMRFRAEMHKRLFLEALQKYQDFCRQYILNCEIQKSHDIREIPIAGRP